MASDDPALADGRLRYLKRRHQADPDGRWYLPLGAALLDVGFIDDAIAVLESGLQRDPASIGGWVLLGKGLLHAGRLDEALGILEEVERRDRENAVALRGLAEIHRRRGQRQRAADYYRALLRLIPWDLEAQQGMAQVLAAPSDLGDEGLRRTIEVFERPALAEVRAAVLRPRAAGLSTRRQEHGTTAAVAADAASPGNGGAPAHPLTMASTHDPTRDRATDRSARRPARPAAAEGRGAGRRVPGIFEPPPRDLGGPPATRRRQPRRAKQPPPSFGNFMRWVQQVSNEGRDGFDD